MGGFMNAPFSNIHDVVYAINTSAGNFSHYLVKIGDSKEQRTINYWVQDGAVTIYKHALQNTPRSDATITTVDCTSHQLDKMDDSNEGIILK